MGLGLALTDDFPQEVLKRVHGVVLERPDTGPAQPDAEPDRRVIKLVRNDQTAFSDQGRDDSRIRRETHGRNNRVFLTDKLGDEALSRLMEIQRTTF